ncbi:MAG: 50S ribosomal protein L9 [bacterium]|nr:50S ribosomal protein L9 [bacterium]
MKVVLLQDVPKLGRRGEIKEVADGFARNSLIPQKKCAPATPKTIAGLESKRQIEEASKVAQVETLKACVAKLKNQGLEVSAKANEDGTLFAAVSKEAVMVAINQSCSGLFSVDDLEMSPIKSAGEHTVNFGGSDVPVVVKSLE